MDHVNRMKTPAQNVSKEVPGPTYFARRHISDDISSVWRLFVDESMLRNIQNCTQIEAKIKTKDKNWSVSLK